MRQKIDIVSEIMLLTICFQLCNTVYNGFDSWLEYLSTKDEVTCGTQNLPDQKETPIENLADESERSENMDSVDDFIKEESCVEYIKVPSAKISYSTDSNNNTSYKENEQIMEQKEAHVEGLVAHTTLSKISENTIKKNPRKLKLHMYELFETEERYLDTLIMIKYNFRDCLTLMSSVDRRILFLHLDELILLHSDILFDMKNIDISLGSVFNKHLTRIATLYTQYCLNVPKALEKLQQFEKRKQNAKQLRECQNRTETPGLPLSAHLSVPFQRFLKYHLLLKNILSNSEQNNPKDNEYNSLSSAVDAILRIQEKVNLTMLDQEETERQNMADDEGKIYVNIVVLKIIIFKYRTRHINLLYLFAFRYQKDSKHWQKSQLDEIRG